MALGGETLGVATDQFVKYNYSVGRHLRAAAQRGGGLQLSVAFDRETAGRYMACTGTSSLVERRYGGCMVGGAQDATTGGPRRLGLGPVLDHVPAGGPHVLLRDLEERLPAAGAFGS